MGRLGVAVCCEVIAEIGAIFDFREIQMEHNPKTGQALERIEAKIDMLQL
ncbi:MAG: hypothetical protein P4L69_09475 [Desulfosporosinus sp.]|nr:hypothetical protein [Desulfosporosinus sp.]